MNSMFTKKINNHLYLNETAHLKIICVLHRRLLLTVFLLLFSINCLHSQKDITNQPKIKIFNKVGQRESILVGENASIILGPSIKPEYSYFVYLPGKSANEYYLELRSNEPLLKEISILRNSIDSFRIIQKTAVKADENFNQTDRYLTIYR